MTAQQELQMLESRLSEIDSALGLRQPPANPQNEITALENRLAEIDQQLGQPQEPQFSWLKAIPEYMGKGIGNVANAMHQMGLEEPMFEAGRPKPFARTPGGFERAESPEVQPSQVLPPISQIPQTALQKLGTEMLEKGTEAGSMALAGPGSLASRLAWGTGIGSGMGAISGGAKAAGASPETAEMLSAAIPITLGGAYAGYGPAKRLIQHYKPSAIGERKAAKMLKDVIGEQNIPGALERIEQSQKLPYNPTTAEVIESPGLASIQEAYKGQPKHPNLPEGVSERGYGQQQAVQESIRGLHGEKPVYPQAAKEHLINVHEKRLAEEEAKRASARGKAESTLEQFEKQASPEEAGREIGEVIRSEDKARIARRSEKAGPEYRQLDHINEDFLPDDTIGYIAKESKNYSPGSDIGKAIESAESLIGTEAKPVRVLESDLQELGDRISSAFRNGENNKGRILTNIKNRLYKELGEKHPEVPKARAKYAEASKEVNELQNHPVFSKMLEKTDFNSHNLIADSAIPQKIVNASEGSISTAHDFMNIFGKDKKAMEAVEGYLNHKIVSNIVGESGNISLSKIAQFRKSNPGAFVLYKNLDTKLANTSNATAFFNKLSKESFTKNDKQYMGMFKAVTGDSADKMIPTLFKSKNSLEKIRTFKKNLASDTTGEALEGAKRGVIDLVQKHAVSPHKFMDFYKSNIKNLGEFLNPDQMKVLETINDHYVRIAKLQELSKVTGAHTGARKAISGLTEGEKGLGGKVMEHMLHPVAGAVAGGAPGLIATAAFGHYKGLGSSAFKESLQRALLDRNYAKYLLQDRALRSGRDVAKDSISKWRKAYLIGYPLQREKEEEK